MKRHTNLFQNMRKKVRSTMAIGKIVERFGGIVREMGNGRNGEGNGANWQRQQGKRNAGEER